MGDAGRVLVTGATGFIGSHTVAALTAAGRDVRVLVRNPDRIPGSLGALGLDPEVVLGDMTDVGAVATAVEGCEVVIHAAAQIGVGGGGPASDTNLAGVRTVVGTALDAGVRRVVYTSSITVHTPTDAPIVSLDSPLVEPLSPYSATKVAAEELLRSWQAEDRPVSIVVPGGVYGPDAPDLINSFTAILSALDAMMLVPPTGTTVVDVRDLAELLARVATADEHVPRVLAGGHFVTWREWVSALERAVGRPVAHQVVTHDEILALARDLAAMAVEAGEEPLLTEEAAQVMATGVPVDDAESLRRFGVALRPLDETFGDIVTYLRSIGRIAPAGHEATAT